MANRRVSQRLGKHGWIDDLFSFHLGIGVADALFYYNGYRWLSKVSAPQSQGFLGKFACLLAESAAAIDLRYELPIT